MSDNQLDMFKGNSLVTSDAFKSLMESTKRLAGGGGGFGRRISIKGGRFREMIDGEQTKVNSSGSMNIVIVETATMSRFYYDEAYDSDKAVAPTCWSSDTQVPSSDVPEDQRQATRCMDCPQNIKGSGQGESRACRFSQRLAIALEGSLDKVYQIQIPATSLFGKGEDGKMPLQAYTKLLVGNNMPIGAVVTSMYFDENSETPKLFFKPVRPLTEDEFKQCLVLKETDEAKAAVDMTVSQTDKVQPMFEIEEEVVEEEEPEVKEKPKASKPKPKPKVEDVPEPEKKPKKPAKEEADDDTDLAALVGEWDDD